MLVKLFAKVFASKASEHMQGRSQVFGVRGQSRLIVLILDRSPGGGVQGEVCHPPLLNFFYCLEALKCKMVLLFSLDPSVLHRGF